MDFAESRPVLKLVFDAPSEVLPGSGGASRDRTGDLLHAMQALSQLSYGPTALERRKV